MFFPDDWIPAFAGMTKGGNDYGGRILISDDWIPAFAGMTKGGMTRGLRVLQGGMIMGLNDKGFKTILF
ncbi:hypothetical protein BH10BAC5_BH10BAC5_14800 [soil metagenome]